MAIHGALTHCGIFINGLDLTGDSNLVKITAVREVKERTTFGNTAKVRSMVGLGDIQFAAAGFCNMDPAGQDAAFRANLYSDRINTTIMIPSASGEAPAAGDNCWFFQGSQAQYETGDAQGNDLVWNLSLQGGANGLPLCFGKVLNAGATPVTADGNGTGVQAGAVGTGQHAYALMHVVEMSLSVNILVTIQSAPTGDFVGATTRFTFTLASATGSEFLAQIAGPITDEWWRCVYDVTGSGVSIKAAVVLAIQ
jgi:hypothetical protein